MKHPGEAVRSSKGIIMMIIIIIIIVPGPSPEEECGTKYVFKQTVKYHRIAPFERGRQGVRRYSTTLSSGSRYPVGTYLFTYSSNKPHTPNFSPRDFFAHARVIINNKVIR